MSTLIQPRRGFAAAALSLLSYALCGVAHAGPPGESIPQLAEPSAVTRQLPAPSDSTLARPLTEICEPGAKWIRVGFKSLALSGYDTLTLSSSGGDSYTFEGRHWDQRQFSARALRGDCVQIRPWFGDRHSRYDVDSYQFGTLALEGTTSIVAGAGDICDGTDCSRTAALITAINPVSVFTAGDNAYDSGTLAQYNSHYNTYWGPFRNITHPTAGNHEYLTSGASGYFDYFNGVGVNTGSAGERGKGYYSWDVGDWHFIALNSNIAMSAGSTQEAWLRSDLAANTKPCTAAVFHHPIVSRGNYTGVAAVAPLWNALYDYKADLVLVGHDHNYQRYGKANRDLVAASDGLRQILIGTGGRGFYALSGTHPLLESSNDDTFGVLKLTLTATDYRADFVPVAGSTFTDSVSASCNNAGGGQPDFSIAALPASASLTPGGSVPIAVTLTSIAGFSAPVTLAASGLPAGISASFSPASVTPAANASASATLTLTATAAAPDSTSIVSVSGTAGALVRSGSVALNVGQPGGGSGRAYALQLNATGTPLVSLALTAPGTVISHGATNPELTAYAGDFVDNDFSRLYLIDRTNNRLLTLSVPGNVQTDIGPSTVPPGSSARWAAAAWSQKARKLYVISANSGGTATPVLGTVDLSTGTVTTLATVSGISSPVSMAAHPDGRLFVADINLDKLALLDPVTGVATPLPQPLGVNLTQAQDMDFDDASGILYMAAWVGTAAGGSDLRRIDLTTGASTSLGHLGASGSSLELDVFSISNPSDFLFVDGLDR